MFVDLSLVKRYFFCPGTNPLDKREVEICGPFSCEKGLFFFPVTNTLDKRVVEDSQGHDALVLWWSKKGVNTV